MTLPILPSSPGLSNLPATYRASSTLTGLTEASQADNPTSGPTISTTTTYLLPIIIHTPQPPLTGTNNTFLNATALLILAKDITHDLRIDPHKLPMHAWPASVHSALALFISTCTI
ncbi:hypothetical protein BDQ12DRAFT_718264 [Crucibulum laeve]|uniref:Uncharacterized protein n=1 Tax=Crucibulum laeve TaxID=68775 RepID=A0A5C3MEC5_9AGAR|nr:hypothetical protein BDQ12DRAFT_718264 [Crucibulum laeve]